MCLDSGAKKVLLPITSAADLGTVPPEPVSYTHLDVYKRQERYRHFKGLSGADVAKTFEEYGIYGYITKYFESLHTMGDHCIVQDIDDYISSITGNKRTKA